MTEKESALFSHYIIDGVKFDASPADLLGECSASPLKYPKEEFSDIIDESTDPPITSFTYDNARDGEYTRMCKEFEQDRTFRMLYADAFTRQRIAYTLLNRLWNEGHYRLGDLAIWGKWSWNTRPLGNMSAFYMSAESASSYIFDLGVTLQDYLFEESDDESYARFYAWLPEKELITDEDEHDEVQFKSSPFESSHPWILEKRKCAGEIIPDPASMIVYIPFDTCRFSLGGSLLAQIHGRNGGSAPHIQDPDYFIDCYEVVRELVEDGIIMAGKTIRDGGLARAAARMCGEHGMEIDLNGLLASYQENDTTKMLFSEVPGVLLQISQNDADYLDSQLLLQDVAYYNIGHPTTDFRGIRFKNKTKANVAGILAALLEQASEGED